MKVLRMLKKFFFITFAIFTFVTLGMVTFNYLTTDVNHIALSNQMKVVALYWQAMFFATVTALAVVVVDVFGKLNAIIARLLKFAFSYAAFALWFFVFSVGAKEGFVTPSVIIVGSVVFVVIYSVIVAAKALIKRILLHMFGKRDDDYENVF